MDTFEDPSVNFKRAPMPLNQVTASIKQNISSTEKSTTVKVLSQHKPAFVLHSTILSENISTTDRKSPINVTTI